jgi:hypothetical protein
MFDKHPLIFWLLVGMVTVNGCAQKVVKRDDTMPATPVQMALDTQTREAAPAQALVGDTAAAPAAAPKTGHTAAPPAAAGSAVAKDSAAAALLPLPPQDIMDTIKKLTAHPRVRYLSRSAQYEYYVGGAIDAEYDLHKNQLVVTNAPALGADAVTCQYSQNGKMIGDDKAIPSQKIAECNDLIGELSGFLAR